MVGISEQVNSIDKKVRLLVARVAVLQDENATLKVKNRELTGDIRNLKADLTLRDSEISHLKTHTTSKEEGVKTEARERSEHLRVEIDQYIQEIDKCIEWLQNQ